MLSRLALMGGPHAFSSDHGTPRGALLQSPVHGLQPRRRGLSPVMDKKCKFEYNKIKFAFRTLASVAHTF